jgi:hypothetical protein
MEHRIMKSLITAVTVAALLTAVGCEKKTTPTPVTPPKTTGSTTPAVPTTDGTTPAMPAMPSTGSMLGDAKDKMVSGIESGLATAKTKLDEWSTKASAAAADKKPEMESAVNKMKGSYAELTKNLGELKGKAGAEWDKAFDTLKSSWGDLQTSMNDFAAKYKP